MINVVMIKTVKPTGPVCTHINTYSESGGISETILNLLLAGIFACVEAIPIPQGASCRYFLIALLFTSRTFDDASFLSKAERILRICWLPSPIVVNARIKTKKINAMEKGTAILNDFDKKTNTINPATKQTMAVLVPDWNIPQMTQMLIIAKKIRSHVILLVIAIIRNVTDEAAALQP